ncbi:MAG: ankyrin repeat domain-containing protein [Alphaproteobacteria bacterium]|nr:ankyrin repeat domain-containing protein [Alphaproteobacteria bacterium]
MKKYLLFALLVMFTSQAQASVKDLVRCIVQKDAAKLSELLANGEDVNEEIKDGNTALHYVVNQDNAELTKILLSYGADVNAANNKGWTPLKIAEKKQAQNVMPLLLESQKKAAKVVTDKAQKVAKQAENTVQEAVKATQKVEQTAQQVEQTAQKEQQTADNVAPSQEMVPLAEAQAVIAQREAVAQEALQAKAQAEEKVKTLEAKVKELEKAKTEAQNAAKAAQNAAKSATAATAKTTSAPAKQQPAAVKPAPKAPVKKLPPQKSKLTDKIYAGDEEVVYCLNYLGQGENQHFLEAAGFYAASTGITEKRYNEIIEVANGYFAHTSDEELKTRNDECSKIITPDNKDKMNQIIHSINKAIGL